MVKMGRCWIWIAALLTAALLMAGCWCFLRLPHGGLKHEDGTAPSDAYINSSRSANVLFFDGHVDHRTARSMPLKSRAPYHQFWFPWPCCATCRAEAAKASYRQYD